MKQLVSPNLTVQGKAGWCLSVAQDVWGVPHLYPKAIDAWNASSASNHPDEQPPDASVPVYWTFYDRSDATEYGHIATWVPGRGVYSSPLNTTYGAEWYPSIQAMTDRINRVGGANSHYLGWSETLSGVQIVTKEEDMTIPDADNYYWRYGQKLAERLRGRQLSRDEFRTHLVGQTDLRAIEILSDDPEADTIQHAQNVGVIALRDNWQGQIEEKNRGLQNFQALLDETKSKNAELGKSVTIKDDEIKKLTAQLAVQSGDTQLLNGFGAWLTKIIVRLGLKG